MRGLATICAAVACALTWSAPPARAGDVETELQQMQERMSQLEERLAEQDEQLEAAQDELEASKTRVEEQQRTLERASLEERSAASGVASFFEQVEFGGWIAASYWYNFNNYKNGVNFAGDPNSGTPQNTGTYGLAMPFHPNSDTFQLDQLWFEMAKPATEESRGGFAADLVMGETADALRGNSGIGGQSSTNNGDNITVYQAYAEWLAPLGPGLNVKAGRFGTVIGAEVAQTVYNFNISRGLVYSILQPFNHVGVLASMDFDNGLSAAVGVTNDSLANNNHDYDDNKTVLWSFGYSGDTFGVSFNGLYGGDGSVAANANQLARCPALAGAGTPQGACRNADNTGILDLVASWDPSENLSTVLNVTHTWLTNENGPGSPWGVGVMLGGRLAITEATGFALRGEYVYTQDNFLGVGRGPGADANLWTITATVDHTLAENLMVRGEVRYEEGAGSGSDKIYYNDGTNPDSSQVVVGVEMSYRF